MKHSKNTYTGSEEGDIMLFNQATDYGFRIVLFLTKHEGKRVEAKEISNKENIPERFLFKIMRKLTKEGIVKSYRGVNGGFTIGREPEDISLLDVVEAIEGPILINACFISDNQCNKGITSSCVVHHELAKLRHDIITYLRGVNFKSLAEREKRVKEGEILINFD